MLNKGIRFLLIVLVAVFCMGANDGCENKPQQSTSGAEQVKSINKIPKNFRGLTVEQQNIDDRIKVTTDPTKVLWIHLISLDGNIIKRMPVRNKVTSSGKRLEPRHAVNSDYTYPSAGIRDWQTDEFIQPDGTYGDSDSYIYWFDPMGRYHQWGTAGGLGYLITDYPIDLENPIDKITGLYKVQKEALEWQKTQEEQLKRTESRNYREEVRRQEEEIPKKENQPVPSSVKPAFKVNP